MSAVDRTGNLYEVGPGRWRLRVGAGWDRSKGRWRVIDRTVYGTRGEAEAALDRLAVVAASWARTSARPPGGPRGRRSVARRQLLTVEPVRRHLMVSDRSVASLGPSLARRFYAARKAGGYTTRAADDVATALGFHPAEVWGDAWWRAAAV